MMFVHSKQSRPRLMFVVTFILCLTLMLYVNRMRAIRRTLKSEALYDRMNFDEYNDEIGERRKCSH